MRDCLHSQKKTMKKVTLKFQFIINCLRNFPYFTKMIFKKIFVFSSVIIMFMYACKNKHFQLNEFLAKKSHNLYGIISNHRCQCHRVSMHYSHTELRESLFMLTHCHPQSWKFDSTSAKLVRSAIFVQMCPLLNRKFNIWDFRGCSEFLLSSFSTSFYLLPTLPIP